MKIIGDEIRILENAKATEWEVVRETHIGIRKWKNGKEKRAALLY